MKRFAILILLCFCVAEAYSAGFRVALQSSKQQGMAHVGAGMETGAAGIFFNPGTLAMLDGTSVSVNASAIFGDNKFSQPGTLITSQVEDNIGTPAALYASFKLGEDWGVGLGAYTPYGNEVEWPTDWVGQYVSQRVDLVSIFIQPTVSYKINDKLGIGAGLIYAMGQVELERGAAIPVIPEPNVSIKSDGFADGLGFNAGVYYKPTEDFSFGLNYRSKVEVEAEQGDIGLDRTLPAAIAPSFTATKFDATLPLPAEIAFGTGIRVSDRLMVGADLNYIFWNQYKELKFDFNGNFGGTGVTSSTIPQNWSDGITAKLGGDYMLNDSFNIRGGIYYDYTPIPDETLGPITPDENRLGLTGGLSYKTAGPLSADLSVLYLRGKERTVQAADNQFGFGQRYLITVFAPGLGINFDF